MSEGFVLTPEKVCLQNTKIKTLQILKKLKLPHIDAKIITPTSFKEYYENRKITSRLKIIFKKNFEYLLKGGHQVSIRTSVEKRCDLLLPRSESLSNISDCFNFVKKTWDFFIDNTKDPLNLGIALITHRFIPSFASGTLDTSIPENPNLMMVEATYGIWEGIQSGIHDVYLVEKRKKGILKKDIPEKDFALFSTSKGRWKYKKLPNFFKKTQIISDSQILELARQCQKVESFFGPARIEFILKKVKDQKSSRAVLLWHIARLPKNFENFWYKVVLPNEEVEGETVYIGFPYQVSSAQGIDKIKKLDHPRLIICLGEELIRKRDLFTVQLVARIARERNFPVLYKGGQLTHVNILLKEGGAQVFAVNQNIPLGQTIKIVRSLI